MYIKTLQGLSDDPMGGEYSTYGGNESTYTPPSSISYGEEADNYQYTSTPAETGAAYIAGNEYLNGPQISDASYGAAQGNTLDARVAAQRTAMAQSTQRRTASSGFDFTGLLNTVFKGAASYQASQRTPVYYPNSGLTPFSPVRQGFTITPFMLLVGAGIVMIARK